MSEKALGKTQLQRLFTGAKYVVVTGGNLECTWPRPNSRFDNSDVFRNSDSEFHILDTKLSNSDYEMKHYQNPDLERTVSAKGHFNPRISYALAPCLQKPYRSTR